MKLTRKASANWKGTGKNGTGTVSTGSSALKNVQSSYKSRFEEGVGTNPEELIAAAHSACFTMKLSFLLTDAGFTPANLDAEARVTLEDGSISGVHLDLRGAVEGEITEEKFQELAQNAKETCPISKLLNTNISLDASLINR